MRRDDRRARWRSSRACRAIDEARELFEQVALDDDFVGVPDHSRVRAHRLKRSRRVEDDQAGGGAPRARVGVAALAGDPARLHAPRTSSGCAARSRSSTRSRGAAPSASGRSCTSCPYVAALGALTGNQAVQQVKAGPEGDLPQRLAGRRRREPRRDDVSRPVALPGELRAGGRAADQQRAAARRPDPLGRRASTTSTGSRRSSPTPRRASAGR